MLNLRIHTKNAESHLYLTILNHKYYLLNADYSIFAYEGFHTQADAIGYVKELFHPDLIVW
jgi:hypothetical protein